VAAVLSSEGMRGDSDVEKDVPAGAAQRRRRRRSRGQAIVEFAMIAPIFFALLFGLLEFALIGMSVATYNFAAKDGARIGSLLGRTRADVDFQVVQDIASRSAGFVVAKMLKVEVFHSDQTGALPVTGTTPECVYTPPFNFALNPITDPSWSCGAQNCSGIITPGTWPACSRNDTLLNADYLGVKITYQYTYLTSFASGGLSALTLSATSVQRIEPQDFQGENTRPRVVTALARPPAGVGSALPAAALALGGNPDALTPRRRDGNGAVL
jgi:hypothetical protein